MADIGYKKLKNDLIATLHIVGKTNQDRKVVDRLHAKYRTDRVRVISIKHAFTGEQFSQGVSIHDKSFIYQVDKEVAVDCTLDSTMCAAGIHYFLTEEAAWSWQISLPSNYSGTCKAWYPNGQLWTERVYHQGELEGSCKTWYPGGQLWTECVYHQGQRDGPRKTWDQNGFEM